MVGVDNCVWLRGGNTERKNIGLVDSLFGSLARLKMYALLLVKMYEIEYILLI